jgi:Holliday junction resolvase RusA-like endonuclease
MIKLILRGEPTAQARVRVFKRGNRVMTFDPQVALKRDLKIQVKEQLDELENDWHFPEYPRVMFWFYMPMPKSMTKKERLLATESSLKHVKKPDVDNLVKLYLDVLVGAALRDDNAVSLGQAMKVYSTSPRTVIFIEETQPLVTQNEIFEGTWETMSAMMS